MGIVDLESSMTDYNRLFRRNKQYRDSIIHLFQNGQCITNNIIGNKGLIRLFKDIYYGKNDFFVVERLITIELFFRCFVLPNYEIEI